MPVKTARPHPWQPLIGLTPRGRESIFLLLSYDTPLKWRLWMLDLQPYLSIGALRQVNTGFWPLHGRVAGDAAEYLAGGGNCRWYSHDSYWRWLDHSLPQLTLGFVLDRHYLYTPLSVIITGVTSVMSQQFVYENWLNQSDRLLTCPAVYGWEKKGKIGRAFMPFQKRVFGQAGFGRT